PQLILEKNLFGLDIDERAAQLTGFALMMKGRADDRRLFERGVKLNVMALQDSARFEPEKLIDGLKLADHGLQPSDLTELNRLFEHATTFGSLIQVPEGLSEKLPALKRLSEATSEDLFVTEALKRLGPLVQQAEMLVAQYDAVVANPPYMGSKFYCPKLKKLVDEFYVAGKADLYGAFILRNIELARESGFVGMITIPNWMFITSFEKLRDAIRGNAPISTLVHNGRGVWGSDFGSCSFVLHRSAEEKLVGRFLRLFNRQGSVLSNKELERRFHTNHRFDRSNADFTKIPGDPVVYWASDKIYDAFQYLNGFVPIGEIGTPRKGMATGDNEKFVRFWSEIDFNKAEPHGSVGSKWFPYNNGGEYRKWYGNIDRFINWDNDGYEIRNFKDVNGRLRSRPQGLDQKFRMMISWTSISSTSLGVRLYPEGFISDQNGNFLVAEESSLRFILAFMCSPLAAMIVKMLNPTMHILVRNVHDLPLPSNDELTPVIATNSKRCTDMGKTDWDSFEFSWDFQSLPLVTASSDPTPTLESNYTAWIVQNRDTIDEMKRLEEENNRLFIDAYGLVDELTSDVPIEQITLTVNPAYRYGGKLTEEELWARFRQDTMEELVSYAIGCMMGRYSLDAPGLIYAHSGNEGFDPSRYPTFPADEDGIVPLTDTDWFADDVAHRLIEFISVAWDKSHLEANLAFLAENLSPKRGEGSRDTIRRYLCDSLFKDHLQTYKKRPIYWLFSSGKEKAFQCLVYLHRYNESTLSRMRTEYVIPLTAKLASHVTKLEQDKDASATTAEIKRLEKEISRLHKQQAELSTFDEKLRHFADQRIKLDLDDGVKVNYGKFGDLLAEVKAITGKNPVQG
ncbi:MAG: BREX-1 system adenine-specific DNA-methyltransferase PglX, partial [Halieaceae bacterium]|nr:BREX-1 system adenine-specific DNA-methyltransferase PglX [Halieaceae bacterium]